MQGYWKDKKSTDKTIINGWLHTGDLGLFDDENYLKILGRKNEMIVNSGGENIAPAPLEDIFSCTSKTLLIKVAESTVILSPMLHVG